MIAYSIHSCSLRYGMSTLRNLDLNPPKDSKLVPDQAMTDGSQYMFGTGERLHEARN